MPADTGVDQGRTGLLDGLRQLHDFVPDTAAFHQVQHRQAINDDEIRPDRFAHPAHDFHRQAHAVFVAAAPTVGAVVGVGGEKLVNEIAFGAHDFDAVVPGALGQTGAGDEIADLLLDPGFVQLFGFERVDRRLNRTRRDLARAVGITPGVEDLQADLAPGVVDRAGHNHMLLGFLRSAELGRAAVHATFIVGGDTAGDHQADAAPGAFGKISGHALKAAGLFFKAGVHRAHQGAIAQRGEAQIQRGQ